VGESAMVVIRVFISKTLPGILVFYDWFFGGGTKNNQG
jgi:hypothetical protein